MTLQPSGTRDSKGLHDTQYHPGILSGVKQQSPVMQAMHRVRHVIAQDFGTLALHWAVQVNFWSCSMCSICDSIEYW